MSTAPAPTAASTFQQDLQAIEQVGLAAASPFVKSTAGQTKVATIASEVNLGIAALPVFIDLFQSFTGLLSHIHASGSTPAAPAAAAVPATK